MNNKILGLMFVCNEDDILEQCIRHNIRFVDELFCVVDFKTVDNTCNILSFLKAEGLNLKIIDGPVSQDAGYRSKFITNHEAFAYVFIDDDEFIVGISPAAFREELTNLGANSQVLIPWKTYVIDINNPPNGFDPYIPEYRRASEHPQYYKAVYVRSNSSEPCLVGPGAHHMIGISKTYVLKGLTLAHFPVRTFDKLLMKLVAYEINICLFTKGALPENFGHHMQSLFASLQKGYRDKLAFVLEEGFYYAARKSTEPEGSKYPTVREPIDIGRVKRYSSTDEEALSLITRMVVGALYTYRSNALGSE